MADSVTSTEQPQKEYTFNPNEHLMQIKSRAGASDYLPVQWRLVWFRSLCPNGTIETEIVHLDLDRETEEETYQWNNETRRSEKVTKRALGFAVCRATVKDGRGGVATGTKSEKAASFGDFLEKAETGAIGRALAALGYGTQFTGEEFDERHRIVDAPVEAGAQTSQQPQRSQNRQPAAAKSTPPAQSTSAIEPIDEAPATQQEMERLLELYKQLDMRLPARSFTHADAKSAIVKMEARIREKQAAKQPA